MAQIFNLILFAALALGGSTQTTRCADQPVDAGAETAFLRDPLWTLLPPAQTKNGTPAAEVVELDPSSYSGPSVDEYKLVLSGNLNHDLVLGPEQSPCLILGTLVIAKNQTLAMKAGAVMQIKADPTASPSENPELPDPTKGGQLWCLGRLLCDGLSGSPITIKGFQEQSSGLFFYGETENELRGVELTNLSITQTAGSVQWVGCKFEASPHYALAAGSGIFLHCTFNQSRGILATYGDQAWALMVKNCNFLECEDGIALGRNMSANRVLIEHNSFIGTRGACLRAWPAANSKEKQSAQEFLIGENWYGTTVPEQIDRRIVDSRADRSLRTRINIRPPAMEAYLDCGASVPLRNITAAYYATMQQRANLVKQTQPVKITSK